MQWRWFLTLAFWPATSQAGPTDYRFEPTAIVVERGVGVPLKVQVWRRGGNAMVAGVVMGDASVDRSPEEQSGSVRPAFFTPSLEYGTYSFRADLPTDGTWALKFTAYITGETQPIAGSVTFKVVGRPALLKAVAATPLKRRR